MTVAYDRSGTRGADGAAGRIGPNAILQCTAALEAVLGLEGCGDLMRSCGLQHHLAQPPTAMVPEADVQALHRAMRLTLGIGPARMLGAQAGRATAEYLLAHRVPAPMRGLLPRLPATWAARVLLLAVAKHAWTFCGSGAFVVVPARGNAPLRLTLTGSATSVGATSPEPLCDYFAATFERLFQALVAPRAAVVETACMAMGAAACVFDVRW
jgi:divinyl protochlorophyllide a 8-vinyl-reductase